jgi:hypothetical protein
MLYRSKCRCVPLLAMLAAFASAHAAAQDVHSDRFGIGPAIVAGWFGNYSGAYAGGEGFVRIARGPFWSARVDGSYLVGLSSADKINLVQGGNQSYDSRTLGKVGILMAAAVIGPTASNGLRPIYGLVGFGGAATRWGENPGGPLPAGAGAGPSFAVAEGGVGSEFHALGNERIELRIFRTAPSPPTGNQAILGAIGASFTIGVVW